MILQIKALLQTHRWRGSEAGQNFISSNKLMHYRNFACFRGTRSRQYHSNAARHLPEAAPRTLPPGHICQLPDCPARSIRPKWQGSRCRDHRKTALNEKPFHLNPSRWSSNATLKSPACSENHIGGSFADNHNKFLETRQEYGVFKDNCINLYLWETLKQNHIRYGKVISGRDTEFREPA